jgi:flagellar motor switch protein FliG
MKTARDSALSFLEVLKSTPAARAQGRLLNTADRDLAALLLQLEEGEREAVYRAVSPAKAEKLRAEISRMRRVRLEASAVERIAEHLSEHLSSDRPLGRASRYFRPHRPEGSD